MPKNQPTPDQPQPNLPPNQTGQPTEGQTGDQSGAPTAENLAREKDKQAGQEGQEEDELQPGRFAGLAWIDRIRKLVDMIKMVLEVLPQAQSQAGASGQGDTAVFSDLQQQLRETQTRAERVVKEAEKGGPGQSSR